MPSCTKAEKPGNQLHSSAFESSPATKEAKEGEAGALCEVLGRRVAVWLRRAGQSPGARPAGALPAWAGSQPRGEAEKLFLGTTTAAVNDDDVVERTHLARGNCQWLVGLGV